MKVHFSRNTKMKKQKTENAVMLIDRRMPNVGAPNFSKKWILYSERAKQKVTKFAVIHEDVTNVSCRPICLVDIFEKILEAPTQRGNSKRGDDSPQKFSFQKGRPISYPMQ